MSDTVDAQAAIDRVWAALGAIAAEWLPKLQTFTAQLRTEDEPMSDTMTDEQLAAIEAADAARTPGAWEWEHIETDDECLATTDESITVVGGAVLWGQDKNDYGAFVRITDEDRAFIAVASWGVPALVAEVRRLRAERDEVQRVLRVAWDELTEIKDDVPTAGVVRNLLLPRIDRTWKER